MPDSPPELALQPVETTEPPEEEVLSGCAVFKRVSTLALPMAASYTFGIEVALLVFFLSRLNSDNQHTASITLTTTMLNAVNIIGISPLLALSMVAGKQVGELKEAEARGEDEAELQVRRDAIARVNHHGLLIALCMTPFVILPLVFSESILTNVFRQDAAIAADTQAFLRPYASAIPASLARLCSEQMMFSFGHTKPAMYMALASAAIGMSVSAIFSFGELDAPHLREKGVLIGYILEAYLTSTAFAVYIAGHADFKKFPFFRPKELLANFKKILDILPIGGAILAGNAIEMGSLLATGAIAGKVGVAEQAAFSSTLQVSLPTFLLQAAFGQSICQEMSRLIGEGAFQKASKIGRFGVPTTLVYIVPLPLIFSIKPDWLMTILGQDNKDVQNYTSILIPMMACGVILEALRYAFLQQLRNNLKDGVPATLISCAGLLIGVGCSWGLGLHTDLGIYGVALGWIIGLVASSAWLFFRWNSRSQPGAIERLYEVGVIDETPAVITAPSQRFFAEPHSQENGHTVELLAQAEEPTALGQTL